MTARDVHIPRKKKVKTQSNKPKSDKDTEFTEEKECTYSIDHINIGNPAVESEDDS